MAVSQWKVDSLNKGRVASWHRRLYFIIKRPKLWTSIVPQTKKEVATRYGLRNICWASIDKRNTEKLFLLKNYSNINNIQKLFSISLQYQISLEYLYFSHLLSSDFKNIEIPYLIWLLDLVFTYLKYRLCYCALCEFQLHWVLITFLGLELTLLLFSMEISPYNITSISLAHELPWETLAKCTKQFFVTFS